MVPTPLSSARAVLLALAFTPPLALAPGRALAQPSAPAGDSAPEAPSPAGIRAIDVRSVDPALSPERVRAAVSRELDSSDGGWSAAPGDSTSSGAASAAGRLQIEIHADRRAVVTLHDGHGPTRTRELVLPEAPESALETLALLSASLVRQDAQDLAASLSASAADAKRTTSAPDDEAQDPAGAAPPTPAPDTPPTGPRDVAGANAADDGRAATTPSDGDADTAHGATAEASAPLHRFPFNLSLAYPLALVPDSERHRFYGELGLFYGRVGGIDGFAVNPVALRVDRGVMGIAVSGVWLDSGTAQGLAVAGIVQRGRGALRGLSVAGVTELRAGRVDGAQVAGAFALTEGALHGMQTAGAASVARDVLGAQIAGAASFGDDIEGAQIAGAASFGDDIEGAQIAGALGAADSVRGLQVAGAVTLTEHLEGAQIAGVFARSDQVLGIQIATVNVAGPVDGGQIGLVNVGGRVRGAQIGLVNVADEVEGAPVGLVNVNGTGRNQWVAWYAGSRLPYNTALKYMHGPVYTLVAFGVRTGDDEITLAPGAGIGGRVPLWKPLFAELDVLWQHEMTFHEPDDRFSDVQVVRGRAALGIEVLPDLALFAGGGPLLSVSGSGSDQDWEPHFFGGVQVF
jgi:hypothetical protein